MSVCYAFKEEPKKLLKQKKKKILKSQFSQNMLAKPTMQLGGMILKL